MSARVRVSWACVMAAAVLLFSPAAARAADLCELGASIGYLFVSEAQGPPWFSGTKFPSVSLAAGGRAWTMGLAVDYADNSESFLGRVPGAADSSERVEKTLSNTCLRFVARLFPGGRDGALAPYLGLGVGPAITRVAYEGESTGAKESGYSVRLCYTVSVGSKLRIGKSPVSAFLEGSYGGLGETEKAEEDELDVPRDELEFVSVAAGLGVSF
ncbi:MAG: hypothetical protein V2A71_08805 [Candidatus Eisenbacteria bacterium]